MNKKVCIVLGAVVLVNKAQSHETTTVCIMFRVDASAATNC